MTADTLADNPPLERLVIAAIACTCQLDEREIRPDTQMAALGIDSLGITALASRLEATCGLTFTDEVLLEMFTAPSVQDLISIVRTAHPTHR